MQLSAILESLLIASQEPLSSEEMARLVRARVAEAEDVAQDVLLRGWRQSGSWRSGDAKFSTWLHRVTAGA